MKGYNREEDNYEDISLTNSRLVEFILASDSLSLYYDLDNGIWTVEYVDSDEGIEVSEELDLESFPIRLGDSYILEREEFETYLEIVKEEEGKKI